MAKAQIFKLQVDIKQNSFTHFFHTNSSLAINFSSCWPLLSIYAIESSTKNKKKQNKNRKIFGQKQSELLLAPKFTAKNGGKKTYQAFELQK